MILGSTVGYPDLIIFFGVFGVKSLPFEFQLPSRPAVCQCMNNLLHSRWRHTAASLLKLWLRELYEPLIPDTFYDEAVHLGSKFEQNEQRDRKKENKGSVDRNGFSNKDHLKNLIDRLPELNQLTLMYLAKYLQLFARKDISTVTKMDASNLATVFAPNCLRCPAEDPIVMLENTRKEMAFVKSLIVDLDTSSIDGLT